MRQLLTAILLAGTLFACWNGKDTKIKITDSEDTYEFFAKYDKEKTKRVQDFINKKMAPATNVTGNYVDISTTLDDGTRFELEEHSGELRIELDKETNSEVVAITKAGQISNRAKFACSSRVCPL
ncbi:hypothetical protein IC229_32105 [Spirosoma sp. BT702]|uniref:Uncharacterized protein n=1 Tax=Spirosoma profusum TaxID=2771354 RepID=A0A927GA68_9BACT|nr:hypothetical protein [Spirosoma profusum]MBD2705306.1 hypothetical protein [Spirosoma profusum]